MGARRRRLDLRVNEAKRRKRVSHENGDTLFIRMLFISVGFDKLDWRRLSLSKPVFNPSEIHLFHSMAMSAVVSFAPGF